MILQSFRVLLKRAQLRRSGGRTTPTPQKGLERVIIKRGRRPGRHSPGDVRHVVYRAQSAYWEQMMGALLLGGGKSHCTGNLCDGVMKIAIFQFGVFS